METLNHANPFFVRCIKSNAEKVCYSMFEVNWPLYWMLASGVWQLIYVNCCVVTGWIMHCTTSVHPMCTCNSKQTVAAVLLDYTYSHQFSDVCFYTTIFASFWDFFILLQLCHTVTK